MFQGTGSGAGKSLLVAGLARVFADKGVRVAPFKSQNMALNSFITAEGAEIGRAQALQARAARLAPHSDMNPVLLKATGEKGCQVILEGTVHSNMTAREYYAFKDEAWKHVESAYDRLSQNHDLILIEGAGSPAEINLMKEEIVNMRMARFAECPVLLVGDIERGGVFASFYGTVALVGDDARLIKGFVINKFRGDIDILSPGVEMMKERTGIPTLGVLPYVGNIGLEEEDGLSLSDIRPNAGANKLRVVVVRLNYISNWTDFDALRYEPDVELIFSANRSEIENADLLIVPGTKSTTKDLLSLRSSGLEGSIRTASEKGIPVIGVCGGYQMLGHKMYDPLGIESDNRKVEGMGLLDIETEFIGTKVTSQSEARASLYGYDGILKGYEIHMGVTTGDTGLLKVKRLASGTEVDDGSIKGNVWGTYLHGVFDTDGFRHALLDYLRQRRGLERPVAGVNYLELKERNLDRWAKLLSEYLDIDALEQLIW
jgi:adenosylcobyric acid synthase